MLSQKLFNTQPGREEGIHSPESQTGLSAAGRECENKHASAGFPQLCPSHRTVQAPGRSECGLVVAHQEPLSFEL